jgi:RNA polymerase sigma-70 factor (ECF subfamily)
MSHEPTLTVDALAAYFREHADEVERVLVGVIGPDSELPDMVQDVFLRAVRGMDGFRGDSTLRAWIAGIAVRTAYGWIRRRRTRRWLQVGGVTSMAELVASGASPELGDMLGRAARVLDRLPARERLPFALRFIDEMELADIASVCEISLATTKRRLSQARRRFDRLASHDVLLCDWAAHPRGRKSSHAESITPIASTKNAS